MHSLFFGRFVLNYKRLPYRTVWVEFSDVENTLRNIGAPPSSIRSDGRPLYSLPVIVDPLRPNSQPVVLSRVDKIAEYLESTYPARPIFPEGSRALQSLFVHYVDEVLTKPLLPILVPLSHQRLPERSQAHFLGLSGQPPLGPQEREQAWRAAQDQFSFLASMMDKNLGDPVSDGVVVAGRNLSYADFALCSIL
jgi:glutathione S-transferase